MARTHLGVTLAYSPDDVTYTDFAGVTSFTPPEGTIKEIDATHLGSTGNVEEWLAGFINSGMMEVEVQHDYTQANTIDDYFYAGTRIYLKITLPNDHSTNSSTIKAYGFINKWRVHDQVTPGKTTSMRGTFGFKCSGKVTYTPAA